MLLAQTVNSLNNEGSSVDVAFSANHVFICYLESALPWEVVLLGVKLLQSFICLLYCYHKWPYCKNTC